MWRALGFLTPVGMRTTPDTRSLNWFPLVGAVVGGTVGAVWWAAGRAWAPVVGGVLAVAADVVVTGGLHLDGLADTADGLIPPLKRQDRLRVMQDPAVGAFGATALILVLLLRFAAFGSTAARPLAVAGLWCGSRTAMAIIVRCGPYARAQGGLASAFGARGTASGWRPLWRVGSAEAVASMLGGIALAAGLTALGVGVRGFGALVGEAVGIAGVVWIAQRRIGGFTGDVLGAAGVVGETVALLILAAR